MTNESKKFRNLPPAGTTRWVIRRKAQVVQGVHMGTISLNEACKMYNISPEEFESWERAIAKHGVKALKATKVQTYKDHESVRTTKKLVQDAIEEHTVRSTF